MIDVAILGAGVSGLTAAWRLRAAGLRVEVFEARDRLGGRAHTTEQGLDLGATWVWDSEAHVHRLIAQLGVQTFTPPSEGLDTYDDGAIQRGRLPTSSVPERRLVGGMASLVRALAEHAGPVRLSTVVERVERIPGGLAVHLPGEVVNAKAVLAALPPSLTAAMVPEMADVWARVPVWMGEVAKCVGIFDGPVWRAQGLSGRAISRLGPMSEVHDLSTPQVSALFGFAMRGEGLEERVSAQFERLFGARPASLIVQRWWTEAFTTASGHEDGQLFGHARLRQPALDGRLHLISCETSGVSPGHLDGAVERAESVSRRLISGL